jgi:hypothetical protein
MITVYYCFFLAIAPFSHRYNPFFSVFLERESGCIFSSVLIVNSAPVHIPECQESEIGEDTFGCSVSNQPSASRNNVILAAYA